MTTPTRRPVESEYDKVKRAFIALWENKGVPFDLRLYICGAVYNAGVRQGDEVFPREIFQKILAGTQLTQSELVAMVEGVHKFIIVDDCLRLQYLTIIVRQITGYLDRVAQHVLDEQQAGGKRRAR